MAYYEKISGKNVYLSPMNEEDAPVYALWMNDKEIADNMGSSTMVYAEETVRDWMMDNAGEYQFSVIERATDTLVGHCAISQVTHTFQRAEVCLYIGEEENRDRGYGKEVLSLLLQFCFDTLHMHNVMLKVFSFNERAIHMYKTVGFQEIGRRRECYFCRGRLWDEVYMDILEPEFTGEFL